MILAVVGMKREAALLARVGVRALVGGGDLSRLERELAALLSPRSREEYPRRGGGGLQLDTEAPSGAGPLHQASPGPPPPLCRGGEDGPIIALLSFGVAGGLDPALRAGDVVIASGVVNAGALSALSAVDGSAERLDDVVDTPSAPAREGALSALGALPADPAWMERLAAALPHAHTGLVIGQPAPVLRAVDKAALFAVTGALACDMESHVIAAAAAYHGLSFAVVRAVSDPAHRSLPSAALAGFGADGQADIAAVLRSLARDPRQLPALIRTGVEAEAAFRALSRAVAALVSTTRPSAHVSTCPLDGSRPHTGEA